MVECDAAYVGETGQKLRERVTSHRGDIKHQQDTAISAHFNLTGHEMRISGLERASTDVTLRKLKEKHWISVIRTHTTYTCLNRDDGISILPL